MPTIALLTEDQELLAFLALAGDGDIPLGESVHDCILMGIPEREALFEHPLGAFLQANKLEEFHCTANALGDRLEIRVILAEATLLLEFTDQAFGDWHYRQGEHRSGNGLCAFADDDL